MGGNLQTHTTQIKADTKRLLTETNRPFFKI